jgi:CRP/FNR family transcriptional regulator, cyclic AMP receptor protein
MSGLVRVLEFDPDLGQGLDPVAFAEAERDLVAETLNVPRGRWDAPTTWRAKPTELGMLILDGVLARDVRIGRRATLEVLGPGDITRQWPKNRHAAGLTADLRFEALAPVRFALLDATFATQAARWPSVLGSVADRLMGRATSASLRLLIHQVVRIDDRILLSLWGLAERFGRVTPEGVLVPIPINHTMMARFVGAQRPTVSQAVGELVKRGDVVRLEDGGWLLRGSFPEHLLDGADG